MLEKMVLLCFLHRTQQPRCRSGFSDHKGTPHQGRTLKKEPKCGKIRNKQEGWVKSLKEIRILSPDERTGNPPFRVDAHGRKSMPWFAETSLLRCIHQWLQTTHFPSRLIMRLLYFPAVIRVVQYCRVSLDQFHFSSNTIPAPYASRVPIERCLRKRGREERSGALMLAV